MYIMEYYSRFFTLILCYNERRKRTNKCIRKLLQKGLFTVTICRLEPCRWQAMIINND
ncbi:hypothetical protein K450DRAFT_222046 [Umbelopsis ramanniana AG]|uniref:Uncharacterized protein n=1 Tax=Umbelopsis ramanniana AG TaxID=1314678 RepID=A0AAD5EJP1_UMBRA|nr:uncharacterized protein K450DRAFT_222046 [Umbelopsis ramanniana AG]KAI8583630.1 hypothetical protein K450DRAFT_222046 [Umbelopsis ramanniana AG]